MFIIRKETPKVVFRFPSWKYISGSSKNVMVRECKCEIVTVYETDVDEDLPRIYWNIKLYNFPTNIIAITLFISTQIALGKYFN